MPYSPDPSSGLKANRAVILTRVSSKEQEQGYSIDAQKHRLEQYCQRRNLSVLKIFELTESSTQGDRHKFMAMIKFVKQQKEAIALVADKVDRVQRSFKEYPLLDGLIQEGKIELHFNTENYIIHKNSVSQERMMWSMGVIMAQSYTDSMRDNIKRSIDQKIRLGEWISKAPIGYLNTRDEQGKSNVIIDPQRALLVRRLFQEYATGAYTLSQMRDKAKVWNLKSNTGKQAYMPVSQIHKILRNPFYYGKMMVKGKTYPHRYEPLIDKALFDKCQAVLNGWDKKKFKYAGKEFVFRGLITCATTGRTVTADTKTKTYKSGKIASWTYLRCANPDNPDKKMFIREEKILAQVESVLHSLYIPKDTLAKVKAYLRDTDLTEREFLRTQVAELQREEAKLQSRSDMLMDLLLDEAISREDYNAKKIMLREQQDDIAVHIKSHRIGDDSFKDALISLLSLASEAGNLFKGSTIVQKRLLVNFVFANLQLKGDKLLYSLNKPFDLFVNIVGFEKWCKLVDDMRTNIELREALEKLITSTPLELKLPIGRPFVN